jgi:hypothetical protein
MTRSLALGRCARDALRIGHDVLCEWIGTLLVVVLDVLIYIGDFAGMGCDRHHRFHVTRLIKEKPDDICDRSLLMGGFRFHN